jgi:tRNA U34 5-methylaminomethyl-2-thiouridine-forming methyltransferase MnmC
MWTEEAISHTVQFINPGGIFVTYAITGNLKRMLKSLGFAIQKIPGAAGKREMLRAIRFED